MAKSKFVWEDAEVALILNWINHFREEGEDFSKTIGDGPIRLGRSDGMKRKRSEMFKQINWESQKSQRRSVSPLSVSSGNAGTPSPPASPTVANQQTSIQDQGPRSSASPAAGEQSQPRKRSRGNGGNGDNDEEAARKRPRTEAAPSGMSVAPRADK
ncbi:hypothetical protein BU23DRAFT_596483 [Bimuria novae-zelandiae CBS 107.79]|uniref:Uncharacterized protein n=1 Tax=Bimuria novae-zelandiae CBS 107.79 TaxID=1447943 RepID=A0A6A5VPI3_9PLEO|nr:hypothetical protein BU23DRAFT_596483 [Bimuria novae-zelandiae CBS 107.79]